MEEQIDGVAGDLSAAFRCAPCALLLVTVDGERGRIAEVNDAGCQLLGTPAETLVGRFLDEFVHVSGSGNGPLAQVASSRKPPKVIAARCTGPDGRQVWVGLRVSPVGRPDAVPGAVVVALDEHADHLVTERGLLRDRVRYLEDIVENSPALIYVKDDQGRFVYINKYFGTSFGVRLEEVVGKKDHYVFPAEIAEAFSANDRKVRDTGCAQEFEEPAAGPHGAYRTVKFPLFDTSGRLFAVAGISTEITDLKRAEAAAREARDEAERASRAKSELLSRMSHELRTPLNSILGFGQLLQLRPLDDEARGSVDRIIRAGNHLLALINAVLEQSRIEAGHLHLSLEPVHAVEPLMDAVELLRPLAAQCRVGLSIDLHGGHLEYVVADYQRLKQVLINLLSNGIKYNRADGTVHLSFERPSSDWLRYVVADTGPGLDPADLDQLFLPFERLAAAGSDTEGTGLGLALSKSLVEAMGGQIGVLTPACRTGCTFYVDLPVSHAPRADRASVLGPTRPRAFAVPDFEPTAVLYVENDGANVEVMRRAFALCDNVELRVAATGAEGLRSAVDQPPDLVLLDLHLPDTTGESVLRTLQADPRTAGVPVGIVSADATTSQIIKLTELGAGDYITKPVDVADLLSRVHSLVSAARPVAGSQVEPADG